MYFLSNDVVSSEIKKTQSEPYCFIGIANPHSLHVLGTLACQVNIDKVYLIDSNIQQINHLKKLIRYIEQSNNRIEYIKKLFKLTDISPEFQQKLETFNCKSQYYIHGSSKRDDFENIEKELWSSVCFDRHQFEEEYKLEVEPTGNGLKIKSSVIGGFDEYYATVITASERLFDSHPFTAAYGSGFLYSENTFKSLRDLLKKVHISYIYDDIANAAVPIMLENRYLPILLWSSNIFCDYFTKKHSPLKDFYKSIIKLSTQKEPNFPELDLLLFQDERTAVKIPRQINPKARIRNRPLSIHTKTFREINKYIIGTGLEVVNVSEWIQRDKGKSKLNNLNYIEVDDFMTTKSFHDTIFIHILVGHGTELNQYNQILKRAKKQCKRLIVLEHNKESKDFNGKIGLLPEDIRNVLGKEKYLTYVPKNRNMVLIYDGDLD